MVVDTTKVFATQQEIINLQSSIIDELFLQLMQCVNMDDIDNMPCIDRINEAAKLRMSIGDV